MFKTLKTFLSNHKKSFSTFAVTGVTAMLVNNVCHADTGATTGASTPAIDPVSVITPMINNSITGMLALITLLVPVGFSLMILFWAVKFAKSWITKNAKG